MPITDQILTTSLGVVATPSQNPPIAEQSANSNLGNNDPIIQSPLELEELLDYSNLDPDNPIIPSPPVLEDQSTESMLSNDGRINDSEVNLDQQIVKSQLSKRGRTNLTGIFEGVPQNVAASIRGYSVPQRSQQVPPYQVPLDITFNALPQPTYLDYLKTQRT